MLRHAESVGVFVQMSLYNENCIINDGRPDKMEFSPFLLMSTLVTCIRACVCE